MNSKQDIIDKAKKDLISKKAGSVDSTFDLAEDLVGDATVSSQGKFTRNVKLALKLTMLSLANASVLRMSQFNDVIKDLEDRVFSDDTISELDAKETIGLYKLATDIHRDRIGLIKDVEKNTNWDELEALLIELKIADEAERAGVRDEGTKVLVDRILEYIKDLKGESSSPKQINNQSNISPDAVDDGIVDEDDDEEDDE